MSLPDFSKVRVLVIGDVMLDRYVVGDVDRISPEAPVPVFQKAIADYGNVELPGGAANVAANVAGLGASVVLMGHCGQDQEGHALMHAIERQRPRIMNRVEQHFGGTTIKTRFVTRSGQHVMRMDYDRPDADIHGAMMIKTIEQTDLSFFDVIIVSDYGKGTITKGLMQRLTEEHKGVVVDPKPRGEGFYAGAAFITPNLKELGEMAGEPGLRTPPQIARAIYKLAHHHGILATLGDRGMALLDPAARDEDDANEIEWLKAEEREVFDVSGAGDTVVAVFAAAIAANATPLVAARIANTAAGVVVSKRGTYAITLDELEAAMPKMFKLGFTNGVFDILHAGHIATLRKAASMCDHLIVAVNNDESARRLKGEGRPIHNTRERVQALLALPFVNAVEAFSEDTPIELIKSHRPQLIFKGGDYKHQDVVGYEEAKAWGGEVVIIETVEGFSTTRTIERIKAR